MQLISFAVQVTAFVSPQGGLNALQQQRTIPRNTFLTISNYHGRAFRF